uniref:metal-response element-binding transcription factor 2-like isoform X1 n=2 Tax=Myxine glutinosa TaxID=7769 RepID=UPI00358E9ADE
MRARHFRVLVNGILLARKIRQGFGGHMSRVVLSSVQQQLVWTHLKAVCHRCLYNVLRKSIPNIHQPTDVVLPHMRNTMDNTNAEEDSPDLSFLAMPEPPGVGVEGHSRFVTGQEVLARWSDGLFYLGLVKKVDKKRQSCLITFEDFSEFWVFWKDIQSLGGVSGGDVVCTVCQEGTSEKPNEIVICDKCGQGYHQQCHVPAIPSDLLSSSATWQCRQCIFVTTTKRGGALKRGPQARALLAVKRTLPYCPDSIVWDNLHRTNLQHVYCYCGGPGEWYLKMLQCRGCRQWFHEACIQCLERPMLFGDRFYDFECAVCTHGPERVERISMRWVDVAHLSVYNLTILQKKKYFDFEREIMTFVNDKWESLLPGKIANTPRQDRSHHILYALTSNKTKFVCGREMKKKKHIYGLRVRVPPFPPIPSQREQEPLTLSSLKRPFRRKDRGPLRRSPRLPVTDAQLQQQEQQQRESGPSSLEQLKATMSSCRGPEGRLALGEEVQVLARRIGVDGRVQYLLQWEGTTA